MEQELQWLAAAPRWHATRLTNVAVELWLIRREVI